MHKLHRYKMYSLVTVGYW